MEPGGNLDDMALVSKPRTLQTEIQAETSLLLCTTRRRGLVQNPGLQGFKGLVGFIGLRGLLGFIWYLTGLVGLIRVNRASALLVLSRGYLMILEIIYYDLLKNPQNMEQISSLYYP